MVKNSIIWKRFYSFFVPFVDDGGAQIEKKNDFDTLPRIICIEIIFDREQNLQCLWNSYNFVLMNMDFWS